MAIEKRLYLSRIEKKTKDVQVLEGFYRALDTLPEDDQAVIYSAMADIGAGVGLQEMHYRAGIDTNIPVDDLLEQEGVMHLHFSNHDDDLLIYAVQYETYVTFVAIDRHIHFGRPVGKVYKKAYGGLVAKRELKVAREKLQRIEVETDVLAKNPGDEK